MQCFGRAVNGVVRRGGFGHFGAGGHERVVKKLTVIARVSDHVDDAHFFFFFRSCLRVLFVLCRIRGFFLSVWMAGNGLNFGTFFPFFGGLWFIFVFRVKRNDLFDGLKLLYDIWLLDEI